MTDIEKAAALLQSRGFKPATPLKAGTLFFQDERGSATIDPVLGSVEIAEPVDGLEALLSPSPSLEEIRQTMDKVRQHLKGNPEWDAVSLAAVKDAFDMLLVRLPQQHTQTTPGQAPIVALDGQQIFAPVTMPVRLIAPGAQFSFVTCPNCRTDVRPGGTCKCGAMTVAIDGALVTYRSVAAAPCVTTNSAHTAKGNGGDRQ